MKSAKIERVLGIYTKLLNGQYIKKNEESLKYNVNERSIQRDIDDIRNYLDNESNREGVMNAVVYDRSVKGYRLELTQDRRLRNSEILALCKILLDSRAFDRNTMKGLLDKLISCSSPENSRQKIQALVSNEIFHYVEPNHREDFLEPMWDVGKAIRGYNCIEVEYSAVGKKEPVHRKLRPLAILFSEYYFYLIAFIDDEEIREKLEGNGAGPTIYRMDRIQSMKILPEKFHIPYIKRFEEGEFRNKIHYMYGGDLRRVRFEYSGPDVNAILDRLPTAEVLFQRDGVYTLEAEVLGEGIDMWVRSQGDKVRLIEPERTRLEREKKVEDPSPEYGGEK